MQIEKILIIRFSSFGDVTQCLSIPSALKNHFSENGQACEIQWVTREDMAPLLEGHPALSRVWNFSRDEGSQGLLRLAQKLKKENFTRVYDAHNSLRSKFLTFFLCFPYFGGKPRLLTRSIRRWKRLLLFRFRVNLFEQPFSGQRDLLEPLKKWGLPIKTAEGKLILPPTPQLFLKASEISEIQNMLPESFVALAPSAAFELKRWPVEHWKSLILSMPEKKFVLLGGPQDLFLENLVTLAPGRVRNLAGKTSLRQSAAVIEKAEALVSNDTGLLHVAEQLGKPTLALMGPAPFGFPSRQTTHILELDLPCRPCSKHGQGPCINPSFQLCLKGLSPEKVRSELNQLLGAL